MLFVARFTDKPGIAEKRAELLDAHFAWLDANRGRVKLAGSLREDVGGASLGGLWIIEAESKADATAEKNQESVARLESQVAELRGEVSALNSQQNQMRESLQKQSEDIADIRRTLREQG